MPSKPVSLDKATQKFLDQIRERLDEADRDLRNCDHARLVAQLQGDRAALVAKVEAAKGLPPAKAAPAIKALVKEVDAFAASVGKRIDAAEDRALRDERQTRVRAHLAELMLAVGKIREPALAQPLLKCQVAHRAAADRIEKMADDWAAVKEYEALEPSIRLVFDAVRESQTMAAWSRETYRPMLGRAGDAARAVKDARARRALEAEIAAVEQAYADAVAKAAFGAAKKHAPEALRRVEKLGARIVETGSVLQRELARIAQLVERAGRPKDLAESLRSLHQHFASGWPKGSRVDEMEREIAAFEAGVARLMGLARKAAAAGAAAVH